MKGLPVLSLDQPWASLIVAGIKTIETRPSPPNGNMRPHGVRGLPGVAINRGDRIGIAATKRKPKRVIRWDHGEDAPPAVERIEWLWEWTDADDAFGGGWWDWRGPLGALVCTVRVVDAVPILDRFPPERPSRGVVVVAMGDDLAFYDWVAAFDARPWANRIDEERLLGDFRPGRWAWLLDDIEPITPPAPVKGRQGVWRLEETL